MARADPASASEPGSGEWLRARGLPQLPALVWPRGRTRALPPRPAPVWPQLRARGQARPPTTPQQRAPTRPQESLCPGLTRAGRARGSGRRGRGQGTVLGPAGPDRAEVQVSARRDQADRGPGRSTGRGWALTPPPRHRSSLLRVRVLSQGPARLRARGSGRRGRGPGRVLGPAGPAGAEVQVSARRGLADRGPGRSTGRGWALTPPRPHRSSRLPRQPGLRVPSRVSSRPEPPRTRPVWLGFPACARSL